MSSETIQREEKGFTLIEVLIALLLASIMLLALGAFSLSVMSNNIVSNERLTAVHLAEQAIETWQRDSNDYFPNIASDCSMTSATSAPSYPVQNTCKPATGTQVSFTITASVASVKAPLATGSGLQTLSATTDHPNTPKVKLVTVAWMHNGKSKSIYLTHLTE
jgi:type IV pilus assembly protein PilV